MIESSLDSANRCGHIIVCPNRSADWRTTKLCLWLMGGVGLLIGTGFAIAGLWLVFPFSGLEVIALVSLMYWVVHQCHRRQVISFSDNHITVEKGYREPKFTWDSEIFWTRLIIDKSPYRGHPDKLFLRSKKTQLEIGEFLNDDDKKRLVAELRSVINVVN